MENRISRRAPVRLLSFFLAALAVAGVMCALQFAKSRRNSRLARDICLRSSIQLCEYTDTLSEVLLEACAVTGSEKLSQLAASTAAASAAAKSQLSVLGSSAGGLYGFFAAAENFASQCILSGSSLTAGDRHLALDLSNKADSLHSALSAAAQRAMASDMTADEIAACVAAAAASTDLDVDAVRVGVSSVHTPHVLSLPAVTGQTAIKAASEFCAVPEILWREGGSDEGEIPLYVFSYNDVSISITKNGGKIYSFVKNAPCAHSQLPSGQACDIAQQLLKKIGYGNMVCLKQRLDGSRVDLEFVPVQGGVLCCDETVKVGVCLATGDILRLDASGYLTNNTQHCLSELPGDLSFADSLAPDGFTLTRKDLALINCEGEALCVRTECTMGSHTAILYYEIKSLSEKRIELLPSSDVYNRTSGQ